MFAIKRSFGYGLLALALAIGLTWVMVGWGDSGSSPNQEASQNATVAPGAQGTEAKASLFRVNVEMRSGGKVQSSKKITMIVAPGVIHETAYRYPVKIEVQDQRAAGTPTAKEAPIYMDFFWHRDGYVSSFNWRKLATDHEARKLQDLWWLLSSKLSGDATLDIPVDGVSRKYRFRREDSSSIVRLIAISKKDDTMTESWRLTASETNSPHQLTKLEAVQYYTLPAMKWRAEQRFSVHVSVSREDYPVYAINFINEENGLANAAWAKAKTAGDDQVADHIRLNGGIVSTFNRTHQGGNRANIEVLGGYLIRKASDREIFQALDDPNMDEGAKADLILSLQLQEEARAEGLLVQLAKMSDAQPGNAFRAVVALGQRQITSIEVMQTLADLAVYKPAAAASVANNALLQMAYLSQIDSNKYESIVDKTMTDYSKSPQMIPDLLLQAQTATKNSVYRDAAIAAIPDNGTFMGKPTNMHIMTSAAKLVGTQAVLGDFKAINHIKSNVLKVENAGILPYYTNAYAQMPIDPAIDAGIREKISANQTDNVQAAYFQALIGSPERCKHNEQFLLGAVTATGTSDSIKRILRQACGF